MSGSNNYAAEIRAAMAEATKPNHPAFVQNGRLLLNNAQAELEATSPSRIGQPMVRGNPNAQIVQDLIQSRPDLRQAILDNMGIGDTAPPSAIGPYPR